MALDIEAQLNSLFDDPLKELWDLHEAEMNVVPKPQMQDAMPTSNVGPNSGNYEHPITQRRNQMDELLGTGMDPIQAHQNVYGDVDTGDTESKKALASSLGRIADDGSTATVKIDKSNVPSILAKDARYDKALDQVTPNDLRTPMNQQVPDRDQTPQDQVTEELDLQDDYDYNLDVAYLQKFGRA